MANISVGDPPRFYRHSGIVPRQAARAGIATAVGVGVIGGAIYAVAGFWVHVLVPPLLMVPLEIFLCMMFGFMLGLVPVEVLLDYRGRSTRWGHGLTALAVGLGIYTAWAVWLKMMPGHGLSWGGMFNPVQVFLKIGENAWFGVWDFFKFEVEGWFARIVWMLEVVVIAVIAFWTARNRLAKNIYCDRCDAWTEAPRYVLQYEIDAAEGLKEAFLSGRAAGLARLKRSASGDRAWCEVYLECCPKCEATRALTLSRTEFRTEKGSTKMQSRVLLRRLMARREQVLEIVAESATG